jgi:hypothetical protein
MTQVRISPWSLLLPFLVTSLASTSARADARQQYEDVCPVGDHGRRLCDVKIRTDGNGHFKITSTPAGYGAADLQSAYGLSPNGGGGMIVAIWGAQADYPNAESDLAVYRAQYGLPPCTSQNGCFTKIDGSGGTSYPPPGQDAWIFETAVDLQAVSAACPGCKILLVEGGDLATALTTVISRGASAFSSSWLYGGGEAACESSGYNAGSAPLGGSGILVAAATGDNGYQPGDTFPAECTGVLAVGGTTLAQAANARGWTEAAWNGAGSQCSASVPKPSWQNDTGCSTRMTADVSAVADGIAIYFTQSPQTTFPTGWLIASGTSFATPFVAGALTALGIANGHFSPSWVWQNQNNFYDVTTGNDINTSNNATCSANPTYFCTAAVGYDGPTGWGTPNGSLLATALPPGEDTDGGASCVTPGGSYSASCVSCIAGLRTTGCVLTCEECTKKDGTQNLGPSLPLPCGGSIDNVDGVLSCIGTISDGGSDEGGGEAGSDEGGSTGDASVGSDGGRDSGTTDATTMPTPSFDGGRTPDSGTGRDGADPGGTDPSSSTGCGCATAGGQPAPAFAALGAGLFVACGCRRRRRR